MQNFFRDNSLSIAMFSLFFLALIGLIFTGYSYHNEELKNHHQPEKSLGQYLTSGTFVEAVFENWESEFLQMGALVILTVWFVQKGAVESKTRARGMSLDTSSCHSIIKAIYSNSLTIALFSLFIISFILHAAGGAAASNEEARWHVAAQQSIFEYMASSQFWFESFQNWQSEFLSVGTLLVLSIFLRQQNSAESKSINASNSETG